MIGVVRVEGRREGGKEGGRDLPPDALQEEKILSLVDGSEGAAGVIGVVRVKGGHSFLLAGRGPHVEASFL